MFLRKRAAERRRSTLQSVYITPGGDARSGAGGHDALL
jgi:hypothetical protein